MGLGRKSLKSPHFYEHSSAMPIIIQRENIFTSRGNITSVRDRLLPFLGFHGATVPKVQSARPTSHGTNPIQDENGPIFQQTEVILAYNGGGVLRWSFIQRRLWCEQTSSRSAPAALAPVPHLRQGASLDKIACLLALDIGL